MSTAKISINFERPDYVSKKIQGNRGPFAPVLMALETLIAINKWQNRQRDYPLLYESGIYYYTNPDTYILKNEELGTYVYHPSTEWHDIPTLLAEGRGDCKDLVAYRIAELDKYYRIDAKPVIKWKWVAKDPNGNFYDWQDKMARHSKFFQKVLLIHVMVQWPNGYIEDPSKILGMGGDYL